MHSIIHLLNRLLRIKFYLGGVISPLDNNWLEVVANLWKAQNKWAQIYQIFVLKVSEAKTLGVF